MTTEGGNGEWVVRAQDPGHELRKEFKVLAVTNDALVTDLVTKALNEYLEREKGAKAA